MDDNIQEVAPRYSGKLHGIIANADGSKRLIYDGVEVDPASVVLTAAEQAEVDSVEYVAPPPPQVPAAVTMRQARLALLAIGKLALAESALSSLPEPQKSAARIEWDFSNDVQRHNGLVSMMAPSLGLDDAALDALFIQAGAL